jgi:hypothetical protein
MATIQEKIAVQYMNAKKAVEMAEKAMATAKQMLEDAYAEQGITEVTVDGVKVSVVEATRRNFNAEALRGLIVATTFDAVTKTTVEPKAFDKAVKAGTIAPEVEAQVMTGTTYTRITTTEVVEAEVAIAV